jgi:transposase-like protein
VDDSSYEPLSSTLKERIEVTVRAERRRRWQVEQKLQIVKETLAPGVITSLVARRHGISTAAAATTVRRPAVTSARTSIRCRSRSLIVSQPKPVLPAHEPAPGE